MVTERNTNDQRRFQMNVTVLCGGVGGARLTRGLAKVPGISLSVVVNTGDDDTDYGLDTSPDLDTVLYTMAGIEGPNGWGVRDDNFSVMNHLAQFGVDTSFRVGDADLATKLFRTQELRKGQPLSKIMGRIGEVLEVGAHVLPMTDQRVRTRIQTADATWRSFREYFVTRGHTDEIGNIDFEGAQDAVPAPGVLEAIETADAVVIAPSNPILSVWPILSVPGISQAISGSRRVIAVSPLFGGVALKGPADRVLISLGFAPGNVGVIAAYDGMVQDFVIDSDDAGDQAALGPLVSRVHVHDTRLDTLSKSIAFAEWLIEDVVR